MGTKKTLREALRQKFYPYVESLGFVPDMSEEPLTTTFRRRIGETVHVFEIRWSGPTRFDFTFGETPASGGMVDGEHVGAERVRVCSSQSMLSLQRKRTGLRSGWFQLRRPFFQQLLARERDYSPEEVVAQVMAWYPEVEAWWTSKAVGSHLWAIRK